MAEEKRAAGVPVASLIAKRNALSRLESPELIAPAMNRAGLTVNDIARTIGRQMTDEVNQSVAAFLNGYVSSTLRKMAAVESQFMLHSTREVLSAGGLPSIVTLDKLTSRVLQKDLVRIGNSSVAGYAIQAEETRRTMLAIGAAQWTPLLNSPQSWATRAVSYPYQPVHRLPLPIDVADYEQEEVYEVESTETGLLVAKRGRGRPVGTTDVKRDGYMLVIHWYLDRYQSIPSQRQLKGAIAEVLEVPVSLDSVKRYAAKWFGSWSAQRRYCWRLLAESR